MLKIKGKIRGKIKGKMVPAPYSASNCSRFRHGVRLGKMDGQESLDRFQADCRCEMSARRTKMRSGLLQRVWIGSMVLAAAVAVCWPDRAAAQGQQVPDLSPADLEKIEAAIPAKAKATPQAASPRAGLLAVRRLLPWPRHRRRQQGHRADGAEDGSVHRRCLPRLRGLHGGQSGQVRRGGPEQHHGPETVGRAEASSCSTSSRAAKGWSASTPRPTTSMTGPRAPA